MTVAVGKLRRQDPGFTLIELLVVIVIVGILASIAVPTFLNQRRKGYDGAAKSDIRNAASFEEVYLVDHAGYADLATIIAVEPRVFASKGVTLTLVRYDTIRGYCFSAAHEGSDTTWFWDSRAGGLQPKGATGCPVTTTGTPGDSITG